MGKSFPCIDCVDDTRVTDSRHRKFTETGQPVIQRRRFCGRCKQYFKTLEINAKEIPWETEPRAE